MKLYTPTSISAYRPVLEVPRRGPQRRAFECPAQDGSPLVHTVTISSSSGEEILCFYADGNQCVYLPDGSLSAGPSVCPEIFTTTSTMTNSNTLTQSVISPSPTASSSWVTASSISSGISASSKFISTHSAVASMQSTLGSAPVSDLSSTLGSPSATPMQSTPGSAPLSDLSSTLGSPTATPITTSNQKQHTLSVLVKVLPPATFLVGILLGLLINKCYRSRMRAHNIPESQPYSPPEQVDTSALQAGEFRPSPSDSESNAATSLGPSDSFSTVMQTQQNRAAQWQAGVSTSVDSSIPAVLRQSGSSTTA